MKTHLKSQALLSVNPSFNFDFISDHIYSHFYLRNFIPTEPDFGTKTVNKNKNCKNERY